MSDDSAPRPQKARLIRALKWSPVALVVLMVVGWWAIHRFPGLASFLVDGVRAVVGPKPIAWAEDQAYAVQDRYNQWRYKGAAPTTYWSAEPPPPPAPASAAPAASGSAAAPGASGFPPPAFKPPHPGVATATDGQWFPVADPHKPEAPAPLYKALVHPDPKRSFSLVAIVAIDLSQVEVRSVPGFGEPASSALSREKRPGLIPESDLPRLLAAFNGGFQAVHGQWGMMVDGVTLLAPRPIGCTVARFKDGTMRVAVWKRMADAESEMTFFRQTPPCLVEGGVVNPATQAEKNTGWGATVDGDTIIRRSAFGLDRTGKIAFYGMGDALTAGTLASAMHVAGADEVAQLDVNWAYPRFFFYDGAADPRIQSPLAPVQNWKADEYVRRAEFRDFFYLVTKQP